MAHDGPALPLTPAQLDIWLAQQSGRFGTEWQLGLFVRIAGPVQRDPLQWAIRRVLEEAEPLRVAVFEENGRVVQQPIDHRTVELAFHDLTASPDPVADAYRIATEIQYTPMSFSGPLFRFALFQTRSDEFYWFSCCHHLVVDGTGIALVGHRIAAVYSAVVSGAPIPGAVFGSLQDLVGTESAYQASPDYLEDQAYWTANLPRESHAQHGSAAVTTGAQPRRPSEPVALDPVVLRRVRELSELWNMPQTSIITAACALLVDQCDGDGPEVVLDFPVSRRVSPESKTLPGMVSGVVPLVLTVSGERTVRDFCVHVDTRIREAVQHQRFPVQVLERTAEFRGDEPLADRVSVNFIPSVFTLEFGGAKASASYTNSGQVRGFGLFFSGLGDQLYLSTAGPGRPFPSVDVADLVDRLRCVLAAMTVDPSRRLRSLDLLAAWERQQLATFGDRALLSDPGGAGASIPELFGVQAGRTPDAVAVRCDGRSLTYREIDRASNRLARLLAHCGAGPGRYVAVLFPRSAEAVVAILAVLKTGPVICRSIRPHPRRGCGSCSRTRVRWWRSAPRSWPAAYGAASSPSSRSVIPGSPTSRTPHCPEFAPTTSRMSSTPRAPPGTRKALRSRTVT